MSGLSAEDLVIEAEVPVMDIRAAADILRLMQFDDQHRRAILIVASVISESCSELEKLLGFKGGANG